MYSNASSNPPSPSRRSAAAGTIQYEHIASEILGLIESYLPPSDCAHLSATSTSLHRRWTARRWQRTFQLHYGRGRNQLRERTVNLRKARSRLMNLSEEVHDQKQQHLEMDNCSTADVDAAFAKYDECYKDGWEHTFVGCCHDQNCNVTKERFVREESRDDMSAVTTQFNVQSLVPSVQRLYVDLWDTIELSLLGYFGVDETQTTAGAAHHHMHHPTHHSQYPVPAIMRILRTSVLPELAEYLFFMVGFKPLAVRGMDSRWGSLAARRRRDGGVMGPLLSRGLGGVRLGVDSQQQQQQQQEGVASLPSSSTEKSDHKDGGLVVRKAGIAESHESSTHLKAASTTTTLEEINSLRDAATTMSAWKLACILRERGVGCLRCAICDRIDLMGDDFEDDCTTGGEEDEGSDGYQMLHGMDTRNNSRRQSASNGSSPFLREWRKQVGGDAWMTPCHCPELVHRQCLERKLKLIPKLEPWEHIKLRFGKVYSSLWAFFSRNSNRMASVPSLHTEEPLAPRVWISYDNNIPLRRQHRHHAGSTTEEEDVIAVDTLGRFCSSAARCETCGWQFLRTVRLPRSKGEVVAASLSDPIALVRAASTAVHFIVACAFLAACEGMCSHVSCDSHRTLLSTSLGVLKWPTTGLNGLALAWWQLQQCCMLHIFFSRRFAAIVDRLWMGPISLFYCRLYFYFIITSALLAASFIPMISRTIRINLLEPIISPWLLDTLQPLGNAVALMNLVQYAVSSTTVICIFWRTNYRIFTVTDGKEAAATLRRRKELTRSIQVALRNRREARQINNEEHDANFIAMNVLPMQRIVGVGAGDNNAADHPIYHGPW